MAMSTQTLDEAARMFKQNVLIDTLQVLNVGEPVTVGINVTRTLTPVGQPISGLVQTVSLENANEGIVNQIFKIKVPKGTALEPGQAVRVVTCAAEPDLVGKVILVDTMTRNGLAMLRAGTGSDFAKVDQQGKEGLS